MWPSIACARLAPLCCGHSDWRRWSSSLPCSLPTRVLLCHHFCSKLLRTRQAMSAGCAARGLGLELDAAARLGTFN